MKIADILDELDLFQDFPYAELEIIGAYLNLERVGKGEVIFNEGDPGNYMLILVDGGISIFKGGEHGRQLLSHEARGRIVGEMAMLDQELRSATCIADTDCELLTLSSEKLKRLAADHSVVAYRFMLCLARLLSRRLRRVSGMMADFLGN
ncbi:CRP/FNR family cyclic AMP-dependent transcriptional regulator [Oxalobacteraceae bacterium GrIS 1.11]